MKKGAADLNQRNKEIVFNTIKITAASMIAILAAFALKLEFAVSAGIVAVLSIQPTKKETLKTALGRFLAFLCALVLAYVCFWLMGFNTVAFGVYLFLFIFVCLKFGWNSAMAMDSVLISHFLSKEDMGIAMIMNEFLIFALGTGAGIVANLHLKKDVVTIEELKEQADEQIKKILIRMSERIMTNDITDYNGECFGVLSNYLHKAKNMADVNYKNQFGEKDVFDMEYVKMREKQCEILYEMYKNVRRIKTTPIQAEKISEFLSMVAEEYHKENTVEELLLKFGELDEGMKKEPLPVERREFEDRAQLYSLLRHLEEFLEIKREFANRYL